MSANLFGQVLLVDSQHSGLQQAFGLAALFLAVPLQALHNLQLLLGCDPVPLHREPEEQIRLAPHLLHVVWDRRTETRGAAGGGLRKCLFVSYPYLSWFCIFLKGVHLKQILTVKH